MDVTYQEFYELASQLYPDQSARVLAELRAMKAEQRVAELEEQRQEGGDGGS